MSAANYEMVWPDLFLHSLRYVNIKSFSKSLGH